MSALEHDHAACERVLLRTFAPEKVCTCGHTRMEHIFKTEGCTYCVCVAFHEGGRPVCTIEEETPFLATHAIKGISGWRLYCDACFADVYGPHDCARLGCPATCKGVD